MKKAPHPRAKSKSLNFLVTSSSLLPFVYLPFKDDMRVSDSLFSAALFEKYYAKSTRRIESVVYNKLRIQLARDT